MSVVFEIWTFILNLRNNIEQTKIFAKNTKKVTAASASGW